MLLLTKVVEVFNHSADADAPPTCACPPSEAGHRYDCRYAAWVIKHRRWHE